MPYIIEQKRQQLDSAIDQLHRELVNLELDDENNNMEGNLNYIVTRLLMMVYGNWQSINYAAVNSALGVLEAVKQEFYRKIAAPYENQKEFDNGPVEANVTPTTVEEVVVRDEETK